MDAAISGQAGRAIVVDFDLFSLLGTEDENPIPISPRAATDFLRNRTDVEYHLELNLKEIKRRLTVAKMKCDALNWSLATLDGDLTNDLRMAFAQASEKLLRASEIREYIRNVLYSCSMPIEADLESAKSICASGDAHMLQGLFGQIDQLQGAIQVVNRAWNAIPLDSFRSYRERTEFQAIAVQEGLFYTFVVGIGSSRRLGDGIILGLKNSRIAALLNFRGVIKQWASAIVDLSPVVSNALVNQEPLQEDLVEDRRKDGVLGGKLYTDLSRIVQVANPGGKVDIWKMDSVFSVNAYMTDPMVMANRTAMAQRVSRDKAFQ